MTEKSKKSKRGSFNSAAERAGAYAAVGAGIGLIPGFIPIIGPLTLLGGAAMGGATGFVHHKILEMKNKK